MYENVIENKEGGTLERLKCLQHKGIEFTIK